ncbi:hypothetical protein KCP73_11250 [Salmonella enterica subsp. enterica]|nr:hypothetical protein KCP73_11250 [Salmonella enterica subsp. enterica]
MRRWNGMMTPQRFCCRDYLRRSRNAPTPAIKMRCCGRRALKSVKRRAGAYWKPKRSVRNSALNTRW